MIQEIRLKNFRSHADTVVSDLRRFNMLAGPNRAGKSGIRDAILVALTGQTEVDESGRGMDDLRTWNGKRKWGVDLVLEGGEVLSRTEGEGPRAQVQGIVAQRFRISPGVIRLCLLPRAILESDVKKRQALLQEICPPAAIEIPDEIQALMVKHELVSVGESCVHATVGVIEGWYRMAYERRTEAKRLLDAVSKGAAAMIPEPPEEWLEVKTKSTEELEQLIVVLSSRLEQAGRERDQMVNGKAEWGARLQQLEEAVAERKTELDTHPTAEQLKGETRLIMQADYSKCPSCGHSPMGDKEQDAYREVALDPVREKEHKRERAYRRWQEKNNELTAQKEAEPKDTDPEALATLERKIMNGNRKRDAFKERLAAIRAAAEIQKRAEGAKLVVDDLEALCTALGPKGLPASSRDDWNLTAMLSDVAGTMRSMGFDSCDLKPLVACQEPTVRDTPVRLLSASEQICFGIAFQLAIAIRTGFNVVAVDEWESLDREWAKVAQKLLVASGCQVFVFNVLKDEEKYLAQARSTNTTKDYRLFLCGQENGASKVFLPL